MNIDIWRLAMRRIIFALLIVSPFLVTDARAAYTCSQQAAICMKKGGTQATCYEPARMSSCSSTGVYVGPSGKSWPAKKGSS